MIKKLKIRFAKFERALAMQILEQEGYFDTMKHVRVRAYPAVDETCVFLRGLEKEYDYSVKTIRFNNNAERDEYLEKVVKWISEEQFATGRKLKIGKECEVSDFPYAKNNEWKRKKLLAILPERIRFRYITESISCDAGFCTWRNARPIASFVRPKIDGDVYTWEMEVAQ